MKRHIKYVCNIIYSNLSNIMYCEINFFYSVYFVDSEALTRSNFRLCFLLWENLKISTVLVQRSTNEKSAVKSESKIYNRVTCDYM